MTPRPLTRLCVALAAVAAVAATVLAVPAPAVADTIGDGFGPGGFGPGGFGGIPAAVTTGAGLVETSLVLGQVDLLSGQIVGDAAGGSLSDTQFVASTLADTAQMAFDAQRAAERARAQAEARRRAEEARLAAAARAAAGGVGQTEVGPDGCPVKVPPRTLRNGAENIGAHELCIRSVAAAASPAAAVAVKWAFTHLGVPYSRPARMSPGYFDCSSFVSSAYKAAGVPTISGGWAPTTRQLAPYPGYTSYPWLTTVAYAARRPGDLALTPPNRSDGGGHVMMVLADGFMAHTAATGDVSHITREYPQSRIYVTRRVVP